MAKKSKGGKNSPKNDPVRPAAQQKVTKINLNDDPVIMDINLDAPDVAATTKHILEGKLANRPAVEELTRTNKLPNSPVASTLQGVSKKLERSLISNALNERLLSREELAAAQPDVSKGEACC